MPTIVIINTIMQTHKYISDSTVIDESVNRKILFETFLRLYYPSCKCLSVGWWDIWLQTQLPVRMLPANTFVSQSYGLVRHPEYDFVPPHYSTGTNGIDMTVTKTQCIGDFTRRSRNLCFPAKMFFHDFQYPHEVQFSAALATPPWARLSPVWC